MNNFQESESESERVSQSLHSISSQGTTYFLHFCLEHYIFPFCKEGVSFLTDIKGFWEGGGFINHG